MRFDKITLLLSNHRHPDNPAIPMTLSKHQIITLLRSNLSPNESQEQLQTEIQEALSELQAQGEIYAGMRNRYCITPPTVLALDRDNLSGLRFRGDRAYLPLTHQVLKTEQSNDNLSIRPKIGGFNQIKNRLSQAGIRLVTVADSIEYLPYPRQPTQAILRSPWLENPFSISNWQSKGSIHQYVPRRDTPQKSRWVPLNYQQLQDKTLLQLPTGEYLWFQNRAFYELEPDTAMLAVFYQDKETGYPLKIQWDKPQGRLNLQGTSLPSVYAQLLWRLSEPDSERYRTRLIQSINHPIVETIFQRLGCILV
ncbi:hypothetical protein SD81_040840 [Tolypothrix campylonemoides VB511288]|nr:hypothetical protein SD81_040840 [Tolypothrix campylonemoides VB511288]